MQSRRPLAALALVGSEHMHPVVAGVVLAGTSDARFVVALAAFRGHFVPAAEQAEILDHCAALASVVFRCWSAEDLGLLGRHTFAVVLVKTFDLLAERLLPAVYQKKAEVAFVAEKLVAVRVAAFHATAAVLVQNNGDLEMNGAVRRVLVETQTMFATLSCFGKILGHQRRRAAAASAAASRCLYCRQTASYNSAPQLYY